MLTLNDGFVVLESPNVFNKIMSFTLQKSQTNHTNNNIVITKQLPFALTAIGATPVDASDVMLT